MSRLLFPMILIVVSLLRMAIWDSLYVHILPYGFSVFGLIFGTIWFAVLFAKKKR
jgi:hypothetical protein